MFGIYSHTSFNIGDDIQSVAARRLLPKQLPVRLIDRDFVRRDQPPTVLIANGWHMESTYHSRIPFGLTPSLLPLEYRLRKFLPLLRSPRLHSWPPHPNLTPFYISFHICPDKRRLFLTNESIEHFKRFGPVGCRDTYTQRLLETAGVDAYFSGCLTLTLQRAEFARSKRQGIYFVDTPRIELPRLWQPEKAHFLTHKTATRDRVTRIEQAEKLLSLYANARLVLTTRLHCFLPCIAFGTPVLFFVREGFNPRIADYTSLSYTYPVRLFERIVANLEIDHLNNKVGVADHYAALLKRQVQAFVARYESSVDARSS
jgi:hypothetical protein